MTTSTNAHRQAIRWCYYTTMHVYALCEPDTGEVRYIGCSHDPYARAVQHRQSKNARLRDWLFSLRQRGLSPEVRILHSIRSLLRARDMERLEIAVHVLQFGTQILNMHNRQPYPKDIRRTHREWKRRYATPAEAAA